MQLYGILTDRCQLVIEFLEVRLSRCQPAIDLKIFRLSKRRPVGRYSYFSEILLQRCRRLIHRGARQKLSESVFVAQLLSVQVRSIWTSELLRLSMSRWLL